MMKASHALRGLVVSMMGAAMAVGCGDGPICPSEIVLVIQSPADGSELAATDEGATVTDVKVRSNLDEGDAVSLVVTDSRTGGTSTYDGVVDAEGDATFAQVPMPAGPVTLNVQGSSDCGMGSAEAEVTVLSEGLCDLTIDNGPIENAFFAPIPVLNSTNDSDAALPNFQAGVTVATSTGFDVEVFVLDVNAGTEASIGKIAAGTDGNASFETTLAQGRQAIRATCTRGGTYTASATHTVHVDTIVPSCELTSPAEGVTVTPDNDVDANIANGIQFPWTGSADDDGEDDVEGETSRFFRNATEFAGTSVDSSGNASTDGNGEFTAPGTFTMAFETQDHAGNICRGGFDANVIMEGCSISITEPSALVTADSNGNDADGLQANFVVDVDTDCAGQSVTLDCGLGELVQTVPAGGTTNFANVTLSANAESQNQRNCTASVTNSDNFTTSDTRPIAWDTLAPPALLDFIFPASLDCGDSIVFSAGNDADNNLANGLQSDVRVVSPLATEREVLLFNDVCTQPDGCTTPQAPGGSVRITLEPGQNDVRAVARDAVGNEAISAECLVTLADIAVGLNNPVNSGTLTSNDGTVAGNAVSLTVCGTVSLDTVTLTFSVDGTPNAATVNAGTWCTNAPVSFTEGNHTVVALAESTVDSRVGSVTRQVNVDVTPLGTPGGLTADAVNRAEIDASWNAVAGASSYILKVSEAPFVDFDSEGTEIDVGTATSASISELFPGQTYFVGVASVDNVGNVSAPSTIGPIIPDFDATGAIDPPGFEDNTSKALGYDVAFSDFNGDGFDDVAVAAYLTTVGGNANAGAVQIYAGSATGIAATPTINIGGTAANDNFGFAITALNWGGGPRDGLAIGAPFADNFNGQVFVFHDTTIAAAMAGGTDLDAGDADITIGANPAANWFSFSALGASLAAGPVNAAAGVEDLIIGVPFGGGGEGGMVVVYGGTPTGNTVQLSDLDDAGMAGLVGHYISNPLAPVGNGALLGIQVEYLGDTRTGNGVGDLGLAYFAEDADTPQPDRVYIVRGRTGLPAAGIDEITLGANDLTLSLPANPVTAATTFGEAMGSIADQNGDGFRDILVTAARRAGGGFVFLVNGSATGTLDLSNAANYLTRIGAPAGGDTSFGSGVANNADVGAAADVNNDGIEDLLIVGGAPAAGSGVGLYIWSGDSIPVGNTTGASAQHRVAAPAGFDSFASNGQKRAREVFWVGDVNNDGLSDICWSDYFAESNPAGTLRQEGTFELLWDDGN